MTTPLLDWCATNPWLAFWLAWPTTCTLVTFAWFFAEILTRGMNTLLQVFSLIVNALVIALRGYAPQSAEANEDDDSPTGTT